jgi:hypothetical protein
MFMPVGSLNWLRRRVNEESGAGGRFVRGLQRLSDGRFQGLRRQSGSGDGALAADRTTPAGGPDPAKAVSHSVCHRSPKHGRTRRGHRTTRTQRRISRRKTISQARPPSPPARLALPVSGGDQPAAPLAFETPLSISDRQFFQFRLKHDSVLLIMFENLVALTGRSAISFPS